MGIFNFLALEINILSCVANDPSTMEVSFITSYLPDSWTFPKPNYETSSGMFMPLFSVEVSYKAIQEKTTKIESQPLHPEEIK